MATDDGVVLELLALPDLIQAKKTQSDKDCPMIRRLVEADVVVHRENPTQEQKRFWLRECRTPELLLSLVQLFEPEARELATTRQALIAALRNEKGDVVKALLNEESSERTEDEVYWRALRNELESLRQINYPVEENV